MQLTLDEVIEWATVCETFGICWTGEFAYELGKPKLTPPGAIAFSPE